jgi:hypothetical protein
MKDYHFHPCSSESCEFPFICIVKYNEKTFKQCPLFDGTELCIKCTEGNTPEKRNRNVEAKVT